MRVFIINLFLCFTSFALALGQTLPPLSGPLPQSFALSPDKLGDISNSVNLFTGDLSFPINLASVPGRNGLDMNVAITYSSNVHRHANTWNVEAPTGVVGLGWTMDYPKILVDNKMTGTREDDTYYISEGGGNNELIYVGVSGGIKEYKPKNHQFWSIKYDPANDKWEIVKEDGSKFIYGDKNSGRSTIQWIVTWNNWIGSSNVTTSSVQKQQALVWNLSEIRNMWGDGLTYSYLNINQRVGTSAGKEHTEASYLSKVTNMFGQSTNLVYANKSAGEYVEPHTENGVNVIDAYQERYEMQYLDYININDTDGVLLSKTDLSYFNIGSGDMTKRLLNSIVSYNSVNQSLPGYSFKYITTYSATTNFGALESLTTPTGGIINYTYAQQSITRAVREKKIDEIAGYAEPKVWIGPDYVVVTRRQLDNGNHTDAPKTVKIQAFNWDGEWLEWNMSNETMTGIKIIDDVGSDDVTNMNDDIPDYQKFLITMQKDFFAVAYRSDGSSVNTIRIYRKDQKARNFWTTQTFTDATSDILLREDYSLVSGEKFVAFAHKSSLIKVFNWNGETWYQNELSGRIISKNHNKIVAGHNYIISHRQYYSTGGFPGTIIPDETVFYFFNENGTWTQKIAPNLPDNTTNGKSYWYPAASFAIVMADDNNEHIYNWDENYTIQTPFNFGYQLNDNSFVDIINNSIVGILTTDGSPVGYSFRYNGQTWSAGGSMDYSGIALTARPMQSYGDDFIVRPKPNGKVGLRTYNANTGLWTNTPEYTTANKYLLFAGNNYFTAVDPTDYTKARLYMKKPNGSFVMDPTAMSGLRFENDNTSSNPEGRFGWQGGYDYIIKSMNYTGYNTGLLQSIKFKNGKIAATTGFSTNYSQGTISMFDDSPVIHEIEYLDPTRVMGSGNTLVTFLSSKTTVESQKVQQSSARELRLHRIVDTEAIGYLVDFTVKTIEQNDGEKTTSTYLSFDAAKAIYDVSGSTCQYNKVSIYPGVLNENNANGFITTHFFNGISNAEAGNNFPSGPVSYDLHNNLVKGLSYQTEVFNSSLTSVSKTTSAPIVLDKNMVASRTTNGLTVTYGVGKAYYLRNHTIKQLVDNITTTTVVQTNTTTGLPSSKTITYPGRSIVENYKYWYQEYDTYASKNILTPVIQSKATIDGTVVSSEVVKYKNWGVNLVPSPWKTYSWKRTGVSDFTAWAEATNPSADWRLINTIDVMDETKGLVKQTTDYSGSKKSIVWHPSSPFPMAQVSLGGSTEVYYEGFEYNASATNVDAKTGVKSYGTSFTVIPPSAGTYRLTYWKKPSGGIWELIEQTVNANTTLGASGVLIDEIRLHPVNADMTTYTYDRYGNILSECDANNVIRYQDYDSFQRPTMKRDEDRNIVEQVIYKTKN